MSKELFEFIEQHDLPNLCALLSIGTDLNEGSESNPKWTPLMSAIEEISEGGAIESVMLLLRHGASVNVHDSAPETTPLLVAILNRQVEAARMLLAAGADPNVLTDEGQTPLRLSVEQNDRAMAELLLLSGASKSINDSGGPSGMNALGRATWMLNLSMIELLLNAGADPAHLDTDHQPAYKRLPPREMVDTQVWDAVMAMLKR